MLSAVLSANHTVSTGRLAPRGGLGQLRRARTVRSTYRVRGFAAAAAASSSENGSDALTPTSSAASPANLEVLLPPGYAYDASANRIADVSRTASFGVAMPNLRPLKEAKNDWLLAMKVGSVVLLGSAVGAIVVHNVQLAMQKEEAGIDATADSINLGYGFGYGYEYGYQYGQGSRAHGSAAQPRSKAQLPHATLFSDPSFFLRNSRPSPRQSLHHVFIFIYLCLCFRAAGTVICFVGLLPKGMLTVTRMATRR